MGSLFSSPTSGSYHTLPSVLLKKKAIINMKNENDHECFKWCITRWLNPCDVHQERITKLLIEQSKELNWEGIKFPMNYRDINRFEKQNSNIHVNVFGYEKSVYILRSGVSKDGKTVCNLLLTSDGENQHYSLIHNMSRLLSSQTTKHDGEMFYCLRCFNHFPTEKSLDRHLEYCTKQDVIKTVLPKKGEFLIFKNHKHIVEHPINIVGDFECFTNPIDSCQPDNKNSFTQQYQKHIPSGFCVYPLLGEGIDFKHDPIISSNKDNLGLEFIDACTKIAIEFYNKFKIAKNMIMTDEDKKNFKESKVCWLCVKGDFIIPSSSCTSCYMMKQQSGGKYSCCKKCGIEKKMWKVRDHCHFTGKYRGAAHSKCNLENRIPKFIPILLHNLSGYDAHLFIKDLGKIDGNITVIPNNEEKYISFTKTIVVDTFIDKKDEKEKEIKRQLRFLDSYKFIASPQDKLVRNLTSCGKCDTCKPPSCIKRWNENGKIIYYDGIGVCEKCINCLKIGKPCQTPVDIRLIETKKYFKDTSLVMRKGVYPYDYMNCIEKFNDTKLPAKELFYSKLNDTNISDVDYEHAQKVWNVFECKNMRDYHDLYLKLDVLLLADIWQNFRKICRDNYKLDPSWYLQLQD